MMTFERDPEEIGEEAYEDTELRMDVQQSIHTFDPGEDGRCRGYLIRHGAQGNVCGSTQRSSVFHDDPEAAHREAHWHGGGDCMCFEFEPEYESEDKKEQTYSRYIVVLEVQIEDGQWPSMNTWDFRTLLDLGQGEYATVKGVVPTA